MQMHLNVEQQLAFDYIKENAQNIKNNLATQSIFITGESGTGKSWMKDTIKQTLKSIDIECEEFVGVLSIFNQNQVTLEEASEEKNNHLLKNLQAFIIDDISTVNAKDLDRFDEAAKIAKKNDGAFGGIQAIILGDFYQVSPTFDTRSLIYRLYAFEAIVWKKMEKEKLLAVVLLQQTYRREDNDTLLDEQSENDIVRNLRDGDTSYLSNLDIVKAKDINKEIINDSSILYITEYIPENIKSLFPFQPENKDDENVITVKAKKEGERKNWVIPRKLYFKIGMEMLVISDRYFGLKTKISFVDKDLLYVNLQIMENKITNPNEEDTADKASSITFCQKEWKCEGLKSTYKQFPIQQHNKFSIYHILNARLLADQTIYVNTKAIRHLFGSGYTLVALILKNYGSLTSLNNIKWIIHEEDHIYDLFQPNEKVKNYYANLKTLKV